MDRRNFLKSLIGGVVATAAVRSFPFRVFSFPSQIVVPDDVVTPCQCANCSTARKMFADLRYLNINGGTLPLEMPYVYSDQPAVEEFSIEELKRLYPLVIHNEPKARARTRQILYG